MKMNALGFIRDRARLSGEAFADTLRMYCLEGVARRIFSQPDAHRLVIRGSWAASAWIRPFHRPVMDLDLMTEGQDPGTWGAEFMARALRMKVDDDLEMGGEVPQIAKTWEDSTSPGFRVMIPVRLGEAEEMVQVDLAGQDTLALAPVWMDFPGMRPGTDFRIHTVVPEQAAGWKLHGLFEFWDTSGTWRVKDLYDLLMIAQSVGLDPQGLEKATEQAFRDRLTPFGVCRRLIEGQFGMSQGSRAHWKRFVAELGRPPAFGTLTEMVDRVREVYVPVLQTLLDKHGEEVPEAWKSIG